MKIIRYVILFLQLVVFSCNQDSHKTTSSYSKVEIDFTQKNSIGLTKYELIKYDTITIPIDSVALNHSFYPMYFDADSTHYYVTGNEMLNSLDFYDLDKKRLVRRNFYDRVGPNGISTIRIAAMHTIDSIFLYSMKQKVLLTNFNGDVLNTYQMPFSTKDEISKANLLAPFYYYNNSFILMNTTYGESFRLSGLPIFKQYNLSTEKFEYSEIKYPKFLSKEKSVYGFLDNPRYTLNNKNQLVFRFGFSNIVTVYDLETKNLKNYPIKSKFQKSSILSFQAKSTIEIDPTEEEFGARYQNLIFDTYRKCYYSFYQHKADPILPDGSANNFENKPISIIIFDEKYNYIGETLIPSKTYFRNYLISKDGLMILRGHMNDTTVPEDEITFDIFKLVEQNKGITYNTK